jgi:hypothetical protein
MLQGGAQRSEKRKRLLPHSYRCMVPLFGRSLLVTSASAAASAATGRRPTILENQIVSHVLI